MAEASATQIERDLGLIMETAWRLHLASSSQCTRIGFIIDKLRDGHFETSGRAARELARNAGVFPFLLLSAFALVALVAEAHSKQKLSIFIKQHFNDVFSSREESDFKYNKNVATI